MSLLITIVKVPDSVATVESSKTFDNNGGSIGRGKDNTWVLDDPERFLDDFGQTWIQNALSRLHQVKDLHLRKSKTVRQIYISLRLIRARLLHLWPSNIRLGCQNCIYGIQTPTKIPLIRSHFTVVSCWGYLVFWQFF